MRRNEIFTGIYPALTTPFENGNLSTSKFTNNIEKYNGYDFSGYVVLGSTGETVLLDDRERISLVKTMCDIVPKGKKVIAGTGRESLRATIDFTNSIGKLGVDAALIITPSFYGGQMTAQVLTDYYKRVADNVNVPVLLYNVPKYTGVQLPLETILETMEHPNIAGVKDSSGNLGYFEEIVSNCPEDYSILQGSGSLIYLSLVIGGSGGILALSDMAPGETTGLYKSFINGDLDSAKAIQLKVAPVNNKIVGSFGVAGIKCALDKLGFIGGDPRPPLKPVGDELRKTIHSILDKAEIGTG